MLGGRGRGGPAGSCMVVNFRVVRSEKRVASGWEAGIQLHGRKTESNNVLKLNR